MIRTLATAVALLLTAAAAHAAPRVIAMKGTDNLKFSVETIAAKPGEELTVSLSVTSAMGKTEMAHNFVLLAAGTDVNKFTMYAASARTNAYIPKQPALQAAILAQTALAGNGETVSVTFKAPTTPGTYVYLCTFPGHYNGGMKGTLVVK
jgi:azurin